MTSSEQSVSTLSNVLRLFRALLGRKVYLLAILMPLANFAEGAGITLLLPLLQGLGVDTQYAGEQQGFVQRLLASLPIPKSAVFLLLLIAIAFVLKALLRLGTTCFASYLQAKLVYKLRSALLDGYTNLKYSAFSQRNSGHYVNVVITQTNRFAAAFLMLTQVLTQVAAASVYIFLAALVNWQFAALAGTAGLLFMFASKIFTQYTRVLSRKTAHEQTTLNQHLVQVLHALKYLVATNRVQPVAQQIDQSSRRLMGFQVRSNAVLAAVSSMREPLSVILVLGLVAIHLQFFSQPLASVFVALLLMHRTTQALFSIQGGWQQTMEYIGSAEMVQEELQFAKDHCEERGTTALTDFNTMVEYQDVSFAYNADNGEVLRDVNLRIPRNQTIAIVGHSGAGKSTLADLLTLLHRPDSGVLFIDGQDARELDSRSWRELIGYVCQETVVFDDTVAANICLNPTAYRNDADCRQRVREAAEQAFATEFIDTLPDGYETIVGDRGVRLSGGQRQRLFIARELYKQPQVLILDEATSALDGASERAVQQSIEALRGQMTVVVIAHRLSTIKNADYIYVLHDGEVVEEGPYEQLHSVGDSHFRRMVELQAL